MNFNSFSGYSDDPSIDHCVAVISFGREIKVLQKYSNDYSKMLHILGEKSCKMYGLIKFIACQSIRKLNAISLSVRFQVVLL